MADRVLSPTTSTVTRRLLAGGGSALLCLAATAAAATAAPHPDAELISLCARFDELQHKMYALWDNMAETTEAEQEANERAELIEAVQQPLLERLMALRAHTTEGVMARVRTVFLEDMQVAQTMQRHLAGSTFVNERLHAALMRDLAAHAGVGVDS